MLHPKGNKDLTNFMKIVQIGQFNPDDTRETKKNNTNFIKRN